MTDRRSPATLATSAPTSTPPPQVSCLTDMDQMFDACGLAVGAECGLTCGRDVDAAPPRARVAGLLAGFLAAGHMYV